MESIQRVCVVLLSASVIVCTGRRLESGLTEENGEDGKLCHDLRIQNLSSTFSNHVATVEISNVGVGMS